VIFHGVDIGKKGGLNVFVAGANWKIPVTYPIVEVLDLTFAESTREHKRAI